VATILPKKKKKKDLSALQGRAFDMFVTLNSEFKHVYKLSRIAKELELSLSQVLKWRNEGKWAEKLEEAIHKARERAANSTQMKQLLTSYLYGEAPPEEVGVDPAEVLEKLERKKIRRITKVVKYLGDVIYEVRSYNHLMFRALTAKKDSGQFPVLELPMEREIAHKAWMESINKLMELFGVGTIKELAIELMANDLLGDHLKRGAPAASKDPTVNINIGGRPLTEIAEGTTIVLSDSSHELILQEMRGEGGKINGPVGYTGPKAKNVFDGAEDAVVSVKKRPDSEGEE